MTNFSQYTPPLHLQLQYRNLFVDIKALKGTRQESQRSIIDKIIRAGRGEDRE